MRSRRATGRDAGATGEVATHSRGRLCSIGVAVAAVFVVSSACHATGPFPDGPPPAESVEVVDVTAVPLDTRLALTTLQGQVNSQRETRLFLIHAGWDEFWLARLLDKGYVRETERVTPEECFARYHDAYEAVVVYDAGLPASLNVATMLASVERGIVVAPADAEALGDGKRVTDLRGRWRTNAEAYRWALDELLPRLSPDLIACCHPLATSHMLRDYLVQQRVFTMWVTAPEKADGVGSDHDAELAVFTDLLRRTRPNIPILGFQASGPDPGLSEYLGVGLCGEYGKWTVVSDFVSNASLLTGVPADVEGAVREYLSRERRPTPALDPSKVHLAICIVESGDSPAYLEYRQHEVWDDPARGSVPINTSLGPAVLDLLPPIAEYYYDQASPLDHLYTAISGVGYVHPYRGFASKTPDPEAAWLEYLTLTAESMRRMGASELGLYTDAWRPFDRATMDPVTRRFSGDPARMLVLGMGRDEGMTAANGTYLLPGADALVTHILTRWPPDHGERSREENIAWLVDEIRANTPAERPVFMTVMALSWAHDPSTLRAVLERLGEQYAPVLLPEYRDLWEEANGG